MKSPAEPKKLGDYILSIVEIDIDSTGQSVYELCRMANNFLYQDALEEALECCRIGLELINEMARRDLKHLRPDYSKGIVLIHLGAVYLSQAKLSAAADSFRRSADTLSLSEEYSHNEGVAWLGLGIILEMTGDVERAFQAYQRSSKALGNLTNDARQNLLMILEPPERNPYVGPRPFEWEDRDIFFGREHEISQILSLVIAYRVMLLYAQSGAGKTSLINARLIPLLEEEGFEVLPLARVGGSISETIEPREISNLYVFNTLMSWAEDKADPKRLVQMSIADFLKEREHPADEEELPSPRVVVFDQFEELFALYQERWREREEFFQQVRKALNEDPLLRVLFVMREDYIAQLDPYAPILPENLRIRSRLERLRKGAALSAITGPLGGTRRSFAEGVAEQFVEGLLKIQVETAAGKTVAVTGEFVEPVVLQVVCQDLWWDLPPDVTVITKSHLQAFGGVSQALSKFYEQCIEKTAWKAGVKQGDLHAWFIHKLITPAGTRGTVYRGKEKTGGIPNTAVDVLEDLHLIRVEGRAGARWYELTHDLFIGSIQESRLNDIPIIATPDGIPIITRMAIGPPVLAEENIEDYLTLDRDYLKDADFALQVRGESLVNAGILDNDIVLIRKQPVVSNGDLVAVALIDVEGAEFTVKRFYAEDSHIRLQPENDAEKPIIIVPTHRDVDPVKAEYQRRGVDVHIMAGVKVTIVGKVVGVLRIY